MLQKSPEYQKRLDDSSEANAIAHEQRRMVRRRRGVGALALGLFLGVHVADYSADVHANQEVQAMAAINVSTMGEALQPENNNKAIIFIDGFGSYDSTSLTQHMSPAIRQAVDGQLWSVNYNNAILNIEDIAKQIIAKAKAEHVNTISLVGYSAGGSIAMGVQEYIETNSDLLITSDFLISTPDGAKGLRPAHQNEVGLVETVKHIPGAQYSSPLRFIGEMAFRAGGYSAPLDSDNPFENIQTAANNFTNFFKTASDVKHSLSDQKLPGTWLMFDQVLAIENGDIKEHVQNLGKLPDTKARPTMVYLGTAAPGYDSLVNSEDSSTNIASYDAAAGIQNFSLEVPGAVHGRPDLATDAYVKTIAENKDAIRQSIERESIVAKTNQMFEKIAKQSAKDLKAQQAEQKAAKKEKANAAINNNDRLDVSEPTQIATPAP